MRYQKIRDILPELISATQTGNLKWSMNGNDKDFTADFGTFRIEIELKPAGDLDHKRKVALYLWDTSTTTIIDSDYIYEGEDPFIEFMMYLQTIKKSAFDVPAILTTIAASLNK